MRNLAFVFSAAVLTVGVGTVYSYPHGGKTRDRELKLECKYIGASVVPGAKSGALIPHECTAEIKLCRRTQDDVQLSNVITHNKSDLTQCQDDALAGTDRARLRVACDGKFIFRDLAFREEFAGHEFIFGVLNQFPVIKIPVDQFGLDRNGTHRDRTHIVNSWLSFANNVVLEGFCAVKERLPAPNPTATATSTPKPTPTVTYTPESTSTATANASLDMPSPEISH